MNWANPYSSWFGAAGNFGQPNIILPVANYTPICLGNRECIPQKDTTQRVDGGGKPGLPLFPWRKPVWQPVYQSHGGCGIRAGRHPLV